MKLRWHLMHMKQCVMWGSTKLMSGQIWPLGHQLAVACLEGLEVKDPNIMFLFFPVPYPDFTAFSVLWIC